MKTTVNLEHSKAARTIVVQAERPITQAEFDAFKSVMRQDPTYGSTTAGEYKDGKIIVRAMPADAGKNFGDALRHALDQAEKLVQEGERRQAAQNASAAQKLETDIIATATKLGFAVN